MAWTVEELKEYVGKRMAGVNSKDPETVSAVVNRVIFDLMTKHSVGFTSSKMPGFYISSAQVVLNDIGEACILPVYSPLGG